MSAINKIIRLLEDKGFTQKDLTDYLAIDKSTFSQWKNGKSQSYNKYLPEIAQFLGVSVDYIVRDSISFDFSPHEDDDYMLKCPICDYDCTHFIGTKNVKFNTGKSDGIALEFFCESGHTFYMLVESYKGNTYAVLTDESCNTIKQLDSGYESAPVSLAELFSFNEKSNKKYHALDEHGKKAVDSILNIEYERCTESEKSRPAIITFKRFNINKASAGSGYDLSNSDAWKEIEVVDTPEAHEADFAVEVDGHSMEPTISDGSIVYIATDTDIAVGEIGLFRQNGAGYIKERGKDRLISHNPDYPDILPQNGEIVCIGRVIGTAVLPSEV